MKTAPRRSRAIDPQDKSARRQTILDAGLRLIRPTCETLPPVNEIAQAAGLAKGTVYLYFKTKEAIFLAILAELYEQLLQDILELVQRHPQPAVLTANLLDRLTRFVAEHPHFLPLASMASSVIEPNVTETEFTDFKQALVSRLEAVGEALAGVFPGLTPTAGAHLLLHTHALMLGLWQMQNWPDKLRSILQESRFALIAPDFNRELAQAVRALWLGTLSEYSR